MYIITIGPRKHCWILSESGMGAPRLDPITTC